MGKWTGMSAGSLKSMIRHIDNKIAYREEQIAINRKLIAGWEEDRVSLAEALDEIEAGGDE